MAITRSSCLVEHGIGGVATSEGFDDDHRPAATWARLTQDALAGAQIDIATRLRGWLGLRWLGIEQIADAIDVSGAGSIGEETVVPDAMEDGWQDVGQKPHGLRLGDHQLQHAPLARERFSTWADIGSSNNV